MDNIVSEAQDTMINQLNFGLPETSQYITDRRFVNYFPSGSNIYSASGGGNKNIRFYISGDSNQYLDLSSIRLFANIKNTDTSDRAKFLRPLGGLHAFMERYRATVGGQIVQDIDQYAASMLAIVSYTNPLSQRMLMKWMILKVVPILPLMMTTIGMLTALITF